MDRPVAARVAELGHAMRHFLSFMEQSSYFERARIPGMIDFAVGNPQDMPMPSMVDALQRAGIPQNKDWFAYKFSERESQEVIAASLREELGIPFEPADIALTNGAFGALAAVMHLLIDPGDEVIMNLPPWFFYEGMIVFVGGVPVKVQVNRETFDLDLAAIEAAITPRTRAIIVNSPNNPTGKIYSDETLKQLANLLESTSRAIGRRIYLISDEPYRKVVYQDKPFPTPLASYPWSFMSYSYGKILLAPGERIGYLAMPPTMPDREIMRFAIQAIQVSGGWMFPNATLQHALPDLDRLSIDLDLLRRKRDRMVSILNDAGYEVHVPEGTFYLLPRSPWKDDAAFVALLGEHNILCLPGSVLEFPGFFRISLTATEDMIERSREGFAAAFAHAKAHPLEAPAPLQDVDMVSASRIRPGMTDNRA
jgi:aspartate aminotransferase